MPLDFSEEYSFQAESCHMVCLAGLGGSNLVCLPDQFELTYVASSIRSPSKSQKVSMDSWKVSVLALPLTSKTWPVL